MYSEALFSPTDHLSVIKLQITPLKYAIANPIPTILPPNDYLYLTTHYREPVLRIAHSNLMLLLLAALHRTALSP